ncbi:type II toxin-antitoxin system Phd/YefM family antitoxin [Patescibacteria group bacterium]|nr:type II toxin-antitoxin system Phd/YefM family antitoxin [Patescibacteria group bacterium]
MSTITSTTLRNNLSDALDEVSNKDYLLIARGKKIAHALVNIDFLEDLLALKNKKYLASIKKARKEHQSKNTLTHDQIFGDL